VTPERIRFAWRSPVSVAVVVGLLAVISASSDMSPYRWALGVDEPGLILALLIALSVPALGLLNRSGLFVFARPEQRRRALLVAVMLAVMFASLVVLVDIVVGFPQTYNVPPQFPQSLLFFAVIGYVAETVFHVLPLVAIVTLTGGVTRAEDREKTLRLAMLAIACLEPVFQMRLGVTGNGFSFAWLDLFVAIHVFAINLVQLGLFRQFDFITAYAFRLVYYLLWHIAWGVWRQQWLF
jgi:hypothetical protein